LRDCASFREQLSEAAAIESKIQDCHHSTFALLYKVFWSILLPLSLPTVYIPGPRGMQSLVPQGPNFTQQRGGIHHTEQLGSQPSLRLITTKKRKGQTLCCRVVLSLVCWLSSGDVGLIWAMGMNGNT
jgi:hypothetical protein